MSEKKPKECEKCGFVDCKCVVAHKITYATPTMNKTRKNDANLELEKLRAKITELKQTSSEIAEIQKKINSTKDYLEIIVLSRMILEIDPEHVSACLSIAVSFMGLKQQENTVKWAEKTLEMTNLEKLSKVELSVKSYTIIACGVIFSNNNELEKAIDCFDNVLHVDKNDLFAILSKGTALYKQEKYQDAIECFEHYLSLDKNNPVVFGWYALALQELDRYVESVECSNKAILLDANDGWNWNTKGTSYQELEDHKEALNCFEKALALDENNVDIMIHKGVELAELERFDEAKKCFMDIISIDKFNSYAWSNLAAIYMQSEMNFIKSLECSRISIVADPDNEVGLHAYAVALASFEKFDESLEIIEKILSVNKNHLEFIVAKVQILVRINLKPKALEYIDEVLSRNFFKDNKLVTILLKKSMLLNLSQEFEKMMIVCNDVLAIDENNEEALIGKCRGLFECRKFQECLDCCNEVLTINENSLDGLNLSANALQDLGRSSESIENYKKMLTIDENSLTALYNLSHILSKQEKYPEALKHITRFMDLNITGPGIPTEKAKKLRDKLIEQNESK